MFIRRYATSATRARGFLATGGTIFDYDGMRVHRFTDNGWFTVRRGSAEVEVFVLGPGGYGANAFENGAGQGRGGAGGNLIQVTRTVSPGTHHVEIYPTPPLRFTRFMDIQTGWVPHPSGSLASSPPPAGRVYGGGGPGISGAGGDAAMDPLFGYGHGGDGAQGVTLNLWGDRIHVGAGGGGGLQRLTLNAPTPANPGSGGSGPNGRGGTGGSPDSLDGGNATGWGNGGGGPGRTRRPDNSIAYGQPGHPTRGFVVIRYPLELLEGP